MNNVDITVLVDRSGSMSSVKEDMDGGLSAFFDEQKKVPGKVTASLFQFDTEYEEVFSAMPVSYVPKIAINPRGGTALLDAIGRTVNSMGHRFSLMAESDRPEKVVLVIITDGQENSSHEYSQKTIAEMVKHQIEHYKWEVIYLGANQDAFQVAKGLGINSGSTMTYDESSLGISRALRSTGENTRAYAMETSANTTFSAQQQAEQEALLAKKTAMGWTGLRK